MESAIVIGGGQSGIAAARSLADRGFAPVVLEAGTEPVGSWPRYYDSLVLFTPRHFDVLPGLPFPGDPAGYPSKHEVVAYLRESAATTDCDFQTGKRVWRVEFDSGPEGGYRVRTTDGEEFRGTVVVAATGSFDRPYRPELPDLDGFGGQVLHSAEYRNPEPFHGQRVAVVGAGNSAVQIAVELAEHAEVMLLSRKPVVYATNSPVPADSKIWPVLAAAGRLPIGPWFGHGSIPVLDIAGSKELLDAGRPPRRKLFSGIDGKTLRWPDGSVQEVDTILLATGFRPANEYLRPLGVLDEDGVPRQRHGIAESLPGLAFVGLEYQRTFLSATLHGVGRDAAYVASKLERSRGSRLARLGERARTTYRS